MSIPKPFLVIGLLVACERLLKIVDPVTAPAS